MVRAGWVGGGWGEGVLPDLINGVEGGGGQSYEFTWKRQGMYCGGPAHQLEMHFVERKERCRVTGA